MRAQRNAESTLVKVTKLNKIAYDKNTVIIFPLYCIVVKNQFFCYIIVFKIKNIGAHNEQKTYHCCFALC